MRSAQNAKGNSKALCFMNKRNQEQERIILLKFMWHGLNKKQLYFIEPFLMLSGTIYIFFFFFRISIHRKNWSLSRGLEPCSSCEEMIKICNNGISEIIILIMIFKNLQNFFSFFTKKFIFSIKWQFIWTKWQSNNGIFFGVCIT